MSEVETGALGPGRIEPRELEQEMRTSFLDYAMSVIVSRALPDVRDGLKPVHRRVLYGMWINGNRPGRPYVKSANIVGFVMGNFHPHGDSSIYDTLVRMAQPFSLRYPLVDGQGNFGSIDDDPAAAMRYTEARLARISTALLEELDHNTVDFEPNYDESKVQPVVLPARFPNLLVNGSAGIAVGMATNMPPHHLGEVVNAIVELIDDPAADVERLMKHVKGPDFPTGAIIVGRSGIRDAYRTGRGRVVVRARAHIEELRGGKSAIVITELPYGVKKGGDAGVVTKIAELVLDKTLTEISERPGLLRPHRDADRDRAEARGDPAGRPEQALQAHGSPDDVRLQRRRARGRRPEDALPARADHALPRLPARDRRAAVEARAAAGREPGPRPSGLPDRAGQPRRGDPPDPRRRRHGLGAHAADGGLRALGDPGLGDPRPPPAGADGARAQARRGRVRVAPGPDRRASRPPRRPAQDRRVDQGGAARAARHARPERRPPHGDRRRRGGARAGGSDRGRGHGDRDHAFRLHQAPAGDLVP